MIMIAVALVLQGISLRKDAKWDQYITGAVPPDINHPAVFQIKAYQSLWKLNVLADYDTDVYDNHDYNAYVDKSKRKTDWREESLRFELAGVGIGSASFGVLALASVIPFFLKLRKFQIGAVLNSMGLCFISAVLIMKGIAQYSENYQSVINPYAKTWKWFFHLTDDTLAMDFYFAFGAAIFHFFAAVSLIVHVIVYIRSDDSKNKTTVESICM